MSIRSRSPSTGISSSPPAKKPRLDQPKKTSTNLNKKRRKLASLEPASPEDVLWHDVKALLGPSAVEEAIEAGTDLDSPFAFGEEVTLTISQLTSNGEGIALVSTPHRWVVAVPFTLPGEIVRARVYRSSRLHSLADLLEIVTPNRQLRDMSRVRCKYFGKCSGCQYQMLSYDYQLDVKQGVVDKAFKTYSELPGDLVPAALPTVPSPQVYGYRTKITPHFDAPRGAKGKGKDTTTQKEDVATELMQVPIGFMEKGRRCVVDIEECPIATPILNQALTPARENIHKTIQTFKRGATLLLRDSIQPPPDLGSLTESLEKHVCITDHKAIVRERVGDMLFEFPAGSFFQNNNSILASLTSHVRDAILASPIPPTHLVDAYCGSGLFSITLSPHFAHVAGIEISEDSIRYAVHNAKLNKLDEGKCVFHAGKAEAIFESVRDFPAQKTAVIIDPPRKGCDGAFLTQLLAFGAETIVYVSCNVHSQARDIGVIMASNKYRIESVRGLDLFPQTAHVESLAILRRLPSDA